MCADLVRREIVDVRLVHHDESLGVLIHLLEVVGGVQHLAMPLEPQPGHVLLDRLDVLDVFLGGVGVVHPEVAPAAELAGDAEVQANRLGVADVQVPVGLRGEPRVDTAAMPAGLTVGNDDLANEVEGRGVTGGSSRVHVSRQLYCRAGLRCRAPTADTTPRRLTSQRCRRSRRAKRTCRRFSSRSRTRRRRRSIGPRQGWQRPPVLAHLPWRRPRSPDLTAG